MRILVIGCGSIGQRHAANAVALAEETAVFDSDAGRASAVAGKTRARSFADLGEALAWGADGVVVATPHKTHLQVAEMAVRKGADVLIEKPIAHNLDGVDDFIDLARKEGRQAFVACNMRFHPAVDVLRANISRLGRVYFARAHYGNYLPNMRPDADYRRLYCAHKDQGGGVILDVIHEIDYLSWFFGDVDSVLCESGKRSDLDIDVEDYAAMIMQHKNGIKSEIHMDYLQQCKRRGCEVVGEKGTLIWQSTGKNPEICRVEFCDSDPKKREILYEDRDMDMGMPYKILMKKFIESIGNRGKHPDLLDAIDAFSGLKVALAAYESAEKGEKIVL